MGIPENGIDVQRRGPGGIRSPLFNEMTQPFEDKRIYKPKEVVEILPVSLRYFYKLIPKKNIKHTVIGNRIYIQGSELNKLWDEHTIGEEYQNWLRSGNE